MQREGVSSDDVTTHRGCAQRVPADIQQPLRDRHRRTRCWATCSSSCRRLASDHPPVAAAACGDLGNARRRRCSPVARSSALRRSSDSMQRQRCPCRARGLVPRREAAVHERTTSSELRMCLGRGPSAPVRLRPSSGRPPGWTPRGRDARVAQVELSSRASVSLSSSSSSCARHRPVDAPRGSRGRVPS